MTLTATGQESGGLRRTSTFMGWTRRIALLGLAAMLASASGVSARPGVVEELPVGGAWSIEIDEEARRIYVLGDPGLVVLDADSYEQLAEVDLPGNPSDLAHDTRRDLLFVSGRRHVSIIDAESLALVRTKEMDGYKNLSPLAVDERTGLVYVGVYARKLILVLDGDSLAERDKVKLGSRYTSAYPTDVTVDPARHRLHVADVDGYVHIFDTRTLEREATVRIGAWAEDGSFLALDREEGVLYATADNTLKALDPVTGLRSWGSSLPTTPGRLALDGANGFLHIVTVPKAGMPGELLIVNVPKRRLEHRFELVPGDEMYANDVAV
ncbi:MAG TPA: hypothetical protein VFS18_05820, partial [Actinomycetota bacterium]|nr:hypothetical protein [Actinomycetota bacterium]